MKQIYKVNNSQGVISLFSGQWSRITTVKPLLALFAFLIIGAWSSEAWGDYYTTVYVNAEPADGGGVSATGVSVSAGTYKSSDSNTQSTWLRTTVHEHQSWASANEGYTFKGWASSATDNSGSTSNPKIDLIYAGRSNTSSPGRTTTYYAIFAGIVNNSNNKPSGSLSFGNLSVGTSKELTITFKHAHAGKITGSWSGTNKGDFALKSGTSLPTNSVSKGTKTITIVFTPACSGERTGKLTLTGSNGGSMEISLSGTGDPYTPTISTTNGSVDVSVGSTPTTINLNDRVTTNADGAKTYTCNNSAVTISGSTFSATKQGTYTVNVSIAQGCTYAACSSSFTITVNRRTQTLTMATGSVDVTTDKSNPSVLNLSTLCTQVGNGTVSYSLLNGPASLGGDEYNDNCSLSGSTFYAWVGGTYTFRASATQTDQYFATTKDFTVTVNRKTQTISWTPANLETEPFVEDDEVTATSIGNVTLAKSGTGADYISIDGNTATVGEVGANTTVTLTATAAQTDVYAQATDSKTISLTSLLKQHITFTQNLTKLKTTDATKKVQLIATSDSDRDSEITFEVSGNSAGVTVTHEGDKWYLNYTGTAAKGIMVTARLDGVEGVSVAASPVSQMVKVTDPTAKCDISETLSSAYGLKSTSKTYDLTIPKKVVLKIRCSEKSLTLLNGYDIKFYKGNTQVGETHSYGVDDGHYYNQDVKTRTFDNLDRDITKVVVTSNASKGYDITEASYERWSYANPSVTELNYEAYALSTVDDQTFTLDYANYQIELSIEGSSNFVLKSEDSFGDCETYGSKTVKVGYNVPSVKCEETAYLRIKDNTGTLLNTVTLHANVLGGLTQNITDHNIGTSYLTTDLVTLTAVSDRGLTNFSYSASPSGVAVFSGAQMTFNQSGTIAITVTEAGNATFNEATATVENVVVSKATPAINVDGLTGTAIPYRSTLNNSTLSGGSANITLRGVEGTPVAGSYAWSEPTHVVTDAPGSHSYAVTFNPMNTGMYNPNTTGSLSITITRAEQALAMNNGTVKVAVEGIDAGAADSKIDLDGLIASQTGDVVNNVKRDGNVSYEVISDNNANATIGAGNVFSATVCGDYTIRATKAETGYYNVVTKDFTVTVEKRGNTLATTAAYTQYVDDVISPVATAVNSDGTIHTSSSDGTIAYYDVAQNKIFIPNSSAKSFDKTSVTIKIWQDATDRFEGITEANAKTITLTVKKYDNPFACSWGNFAKTVNFDEVVQTQLTTKNTDYTHFPIEIEQTSGEKIATLVRNDDTNNTITASHFVGDATWHMTQPESYKYKASEANLSLSVRVIDGEECFILDDNSEHKFTTGITDGSGHYDTPIAISGPVKAISFDAKRDPLGDLFTSGGNFVVQYSVDNGSHWRTIADKLDLDWLDYDSYGPFEFIGLASDERVSHIRFGATVGGTLSKYYKNIQITRTTNIKPLDANGNHITTLTMPQSTVDGSTTAQFYLNYSSCDDVIKIVSDNAHFTVDPSEISVDHSKDFNNATITVTYHSNDKGTHTGTITIYTKYQNETLTVTGKTDKKIQTLTWEEGYTEKTLSLPVGLEIKNTNNVVSASGGGAVIYTTSDEDIIQIIQGGLGFKIIGEGTATLTATQAGDDNWFEVSETKTINATYKKLQEIVWTQDFIRNMAVDQEIPLDAKVFIRDLKNNTFKYNAAQTALITYSCPANTVIDLDEENKKITIKGYGQTSITASLPMGSEEYEDAAPVTLIVKVRKPSEGCETPWIVDQASTIELFDDNVLGGSAIDFSNWTTPELTSEPILLDTVNNGKPDKLSYQYDAEKYSLRVGIVLIEVCSGKVVAQQRVDGVWFDIEGSAYEQNYTLTDWVAGAYTWREVKDLQLDENADAIRFKRFVGGAGHHNFKDIQISRLHYLRPTHATVELGNITIGEDRHATVGIDYSDIKKDLSAAKGNDEDATFSVDESTILVECGSFGHYDVPITVHPTELGEWSNTVIVTDKFTGETVTIVVNANVIPEFIHTYEVAGEWGEQTHWKDDKKPTYKDDVRIAADVTIVDDITVNGMTIEPNVTVTVNPGVTLTLRDGVSRPRTLYGNLHVKDGGKVVVGTGAFMINDFMLDAALGNTVKGSSSGQVLDDNDEFIVNGDAYFQMDLDPDGEISTGWYDFVVPFEVNVSSGIYLAATATEPMRKLTNGVDYAVMRYDEGLRASGEYDWKKYSGNMEPGRVYTITVDPRHGWNTILFVKKNNKGEAIGDSNTFTTACSEGANEKKGWNGFGNGTLRHVEFNKLLNGFKEDDDVKVQLYDHTNNVYVPRTADSFTYAVGTSFFMQVDAEKTIKLSPATNDFAFLAPARNGHYTSEFTLTLTAENAEYASDRLWVSASEEATGEYVIGRDLLKMGTLTEAKVAQMWTVSNNNRLCDIELPLANDAARCDLHLFAPQAKKYSLAVEKAPQDVVLYLTYNDRPIWNLTMSSYEFDLEQGTTEGYGLQLYVRQSPEVATGVDGVQDAEIGVQKVLINDKIYLITPEGAIFSVTGKKIQ